MKLLIQYGAKVLNSSNESLLVSENAPELNALLKLTIACQDNYFEIIDDSISTKDIKDFLKWQLSITPENSRFFDKHLSELNNLKSFLATKPKLVSNEAIQKLNEYIASKGSVSDNIENVKDLIDEIENQKLELTGDMPNDWAETT